MKILVISSQLFISIYLNTIIYKKRKINNNYILIRIIMEVEFDLKKVEKFEFLV